MQVLQFVIVYIPVKLMHTFYLPNSLSYSVGTCVLSMKYIGSQIICYWKNHIYSRCCNNKILNLQALSSNLVNYNNARARGVYFFTGACGIYTLTMAYVQQEIITSTGSELSYVSSIFSILHTSQVDSCCGVLEICIAKTMPAMSSKNSHWKRQRNHPKCNGDYFCACIPARDM